MARIRYIKPGFFTDEDLGNLPIETRLTFAGLWCYADKAGRLEDRPRFLKAMIFPYQEIDMDLQLDLLSKPKKNGKPFINRYLTDGQQIIQILNWAEHQRPHHTEADSKLPEFSKTSIKKEPSNNEPLNNGELTVREREGMGMGMEKGMGRKAGKPLVDNSPENGARLNQETKDTLYKLLTKFPKFPSAKLIGIALNQKKHPEAILYSLKETLAKSDGSDPGGYFLKILNRSSGTLYADEHTAAVKKDNIFGNLLEGIKKLNGGEK